MPWQVACLVTAERHLSVLGNIFLGTTKLPVLAFLPPFGSLLGWSNLTSECSAASPSLQTSFYGNRRQNYILGAGKLNGNRRQNYILGAVTYPNPCFTKIKSKVH